MWASGWATARRRRETEELRRLLRRETVVAERVRIARELHDIVGHSVNAVLVQAGAGRMVLDTDPERTRELLMSVERTGRDALAELDRLLGVLRADADADAEALGAPGAPVMTFPEDTARGPRPVRPDRPYALLLVAGVLTTGAAALAVLAQASPARRAPAPAAVEENPSPAGRTGT